MSEIRIKKNIHKGKRCFIVATGQGINSLDLSLLKDEITIGINLILRKEDFIPDYLCVSDTTVLERHYDEIYDDKMANGHFVVVNGCNTYGSPQHHSMKGICTEGSGSTCSGRFEIPERYKVHTVMHEEKSGVCQKFFERLGQKSMGKLIMTRLDEYYIDSELRTISVYGCSSLDALAIPVAAYLGCTEIYLIGSDGGRGHFYDDNSGKRHMELGFVKNILSDLGISLFNADPTNALKGVQWCSFNSLF